jgi:hypothetical protein
MLMGGGKSALNYKSMRYSRIGLMFGAVFFFLFRVIARRNDEAIQTYALIFNGLIRSSQ